ncbi:MAG: hypothetical protein ABI977_11480 [Acidobacteriota bacterium]
MNQPDEELDRGEVLKQLLGTGNCLAAEQFAHSVEAGWQRGESLGEVARALASAGESDQACRVWEEAIATARKGEDEGDVQDSMDSSSVLWEIAEDLALVGEQERANEVANAIKNDWKRQKALQGLKDIEGGGKGSFYKIHNHESL